jgi:hypothetical protein
MAKKKITKKPSKKGLKQKQKQSQSVVVNVNTTKSGGKRQTSRPSQSSQPVYRPQTQYITMQSEPSPPVIHNTVGSVKETVLETVNTPTKLTNSIGIQTFIPQTVMIRKSKIPLPIATPKKDEVINLADIYETHDTIQQGNPMNTPIARRTRAQHPLTPDEVERRRLERNEKARAKRVEKRLGF